MATRITSEAMPESSHDLAVITPALPEAHMADTDMAGPWKSFSFMSMQMTVEGIMLTHWRARTRLAVDRWNSLHISTSPRTRLWITPTTGPGFHPRSRASVIASRAAKRSACMKRLGPSRRSPSAEMVEM